ncbi:MAG TPA: hypothetical protein VF658_01775 [Pyrinomonadaceae bacterium]|jgi:hypothetical protein
MKQTVIRVLLSIGAGFSIYLFLYAVVLFYEPELNEQALMKPNLTTRLLFWPYPLLHGFHYGFKSIATFFIDVALFSLLSYLILKWRRIPREL